MFKIATWNVNSLRVRVPQVLEWLAKESPDILALQETKLPDADFLLKEINDAGYQVVFSGQKAYNGVAILSKEPISQIITEFPAFPDPQRRVLAASVGSLRILNLYIPNGESLVSDKFQYKLNWLDHLKQFVSHELKTHEKIIILGDFNIAPEAVDVHDPNVWEGQILCSENERSRFKDLISLGFQDCFRLHPQDDKSFSWWDYRLNAFKRNLGLRIDHILASKGLSGHCTKCYIDKTTRAVERPSDHAVVVAEFSKNGLA